MIRYFIFYYGLYFGMLFLLDNIWFKLIGFNAMFYIGDLILLWRLYKREKNVKSYLKRMEITTEEYMEMNGLVKIGIPLQTEMMIYNLYNIGIIALGMVHRIFYLKMEMTYVGFYSWLGLYILFIGLIYYYLIQYRIYLKDLRIKLRECRIS
jgi:hypothetical protein